MVAPKHTLRRRAAWAVLSPVLDEDALIEALWLQHDSMRGESVSDIIGYIDAVAARHLLDVATRKRLYAEYFDALRQAEETLPIDPWPLMLLTRPGLATPAPAAPAPVRPMMAPAPQAAPAVAAPYAPPYASPYAAPYAAPYIPPVVQAMTPPPAPMAAPEPAPAPVPPPEPAAPAATPAQAVFGTLAAGMAAGVRQFHPQALGDWMGDSRRRLERARVATALRQAAGEALSAQDPAAWQRLEGSIEDLSALVHALYVALCDALGPVDADHVLVQAVRLAEQRPEARQVPPNRFL